MDNDFLQRIIKSGLPVHNLSGLPVFYNDGNDNFLLWNKVKKNRCKAIVISTPRSGTHCTSKLLEQLGLIYGGIHASPKTETDVVQDRRCLKLDERGRPYWQEYRLAVADLARLLGPGQFIQGHVPFSAENQAALADCKIVVAQRNLRDVAVSSMRFVASLHAKGMRFRAGLNVDWCPLPDGADKMLAYLHAFGDGVRRHVAKIRPWERQANAFVLDFDVLNGADEAAALASVIALASFLGTPIDAGRARSVRTLSIGRNTPTWTGKLSRWQELWSEAVEQAFCSIVLDGSAPLPEMALAHPTTPPRPPGSAVPASTVAWLKQERVVHSALEATPAALAGISADIFASRLLAGAGLRQVDFDLAAGAFGKDGVTTAWRDGCATLSSVAGFHGHKHITLALDMPVLCVSTLEVLHHPRRGASHCMLQMGNDTGFFNSFIDCDTMQVTRIVSSGASIGLCTALAAAPDGAVKLALSGIIGTGSAAYARIYLCDAQGRLDFTEPVSLVLSRVSLLDGAGLFGPG